MKILSDLEHSESRNVCEIIVRGRLIRKRA